MRYHIKCKLNSEEKQHLREAIKSGSLARGKIFYEGMQTALREGTIDENNIVHFIEICYCLEGGLYPMAMEIPILNEYFGSITEIKDARLREQCTMECEFCDCTRSIKLPGKPLINELDIPKDEPEKNNNTFVDMGRIRLDRKKQKEGIEGLRKVVYIEGNYMRINKKIKPIFVGASISGLFVIFYDGTAYFRVKNIPDNHEAHKILQEIGLGQVYGSVDSMKNTARNSLAKSDKRSNVV